MLFFKSLERPLFADPESLHQASGVRITAPFIRWTIGTQGNMKLSVELNGVPKPADVVFAGRHDFGFLAEWRATLGEDKNPFRVDALDFAQLAVHRFEAHSEVEVYAETITDIGDHISVNPKCEVANFVLLKCDWFEQSQVIGLAHFRRTWSNNLVLDYLSAHPFITRPTMGYNQTVRGVGTALIYFLCTVAKAYDCQYIWGEATSTSWPFYKKIFLLDNVEDLIHAPKRNFLDFIDHFGKKFEERAGVSPKDAALEEIYDLEVQDTPFVGSKTAVYNPNRRLAFHFLELPYHAQVEIAKSLGLLQDDDAGQQASEQFRRFFQRASGTGKLADLWREVEKKHPEGEPDKNPFAQS